MAPLKPLRVELRHQTEDPVEHVFTLQDTRVGYRFVIYVDMMHMPSHR